MPGDRPKILLIQPPIYDFALYDLYLKPAGLLQVGRLLADSGYEVSFVNGLDYHDPFSAEIFGRPRRKTDGTGKFFRERIELPSVLRPAGRTYARYGLHRDVFTTRIREAFNGVPPEVVMIGTGMTYWYQGVQEAVRTVRILYPGVPIIAGGVYATLLPDHCRNVCEVDYTVQGPVFPGINGILESLSLPPLPDPAKGYRVLMCKEIWKDAGVLLLNRGCPFSCAYCASGVVSGPFKAGDPDILFKTAMDMHKSCGTNIFAFYDDALMADKEGVLFPFLERVRGKGAPFSFYLPNAVHVTFIDDRTALALYKSGFREVRLGLESSSAEFHAHLDGKVTGNAFFNTLRALENAGFSRRDVTVYILAGLPEQYAAEVEESLEFASAGGVQISLSEYSPVPGSRLWEKSVETASFDLTGEPLFHNNTFFPMEWGNFTAADLSRLKKRVRIHNQLVRST